MAKILVADDNSNIQKMVGLALKDHGIEVVAVGNGEAAVRKIADIRPDLVLADVFMPVRNGYEVCQFVKADETLKHIPVILLVGAFDPLDEQEAQRVGADGVLKKPFVPPDPLISMVKAALVRAGVAHAGFVPAKPVAEVPAEVPVEPARSLPTIAAVAKPILPESEEAESFVEEVPARPAALQIASGQEPVAFGNLFGTSGTETQEEPNEVTAVPALERDWRTDKAEDDEEEELDEDAEAKPSWRRDEGSDISEDEAATFVPESANKPSPVPEGAWGDAGTLEGPTRSRRHEAWTPTREKQDLSEAAEAPETSHAAVSDFRNIPAAPFSGEAWAAAIETGSQNKVAVAEEEHPTPRADELEAMVGHAEPEEAARQENFVPHIEPALLPEAVVPVVDSMLAQPATSEKPSAGGNGNSSVTPSWFSTPPNPWEAETQRATRLATTWDAAVAAALPARCTSETAPPTVEAISSFDTATVPDEIEVVSGSGAANPGETGEDTRGEGSPAAVAVDIDAVVARVLARMTPGKLQELTRDLLKPVVEEMVREELNKKS